MKQPPTSNTESNNNLNGSRFVWGCFRILFSPSIAVAMLMTPLISIEISKITGCSKSISFVESVAFVAVTMYQSVGIGKLVYIICINGSLAAGRALICLLMIFCTFMLPVLFFYHLSVDAQSGYQFTAQSLAGWFPLIIVYMASISKIYNSIYTEARRNNFIQFNDNPHKIF